MSTKEGRGVKGQRCQGQKDSSPHDMDSPDLSAIDKVSFLAGLQIKYGNPLHSTALEEDLNVEEEGRMNKGKDKRNGNPQTLKSTVNQRGTAMKMKETDRNEEKEEGKKKRSRRSSGGTVKPRPEKDEETKKKKRASQAETQELNVERKESEPSAVLQKGNRSKPTASRDKGWVGKKPVKRLSGGQASAARWVKKQPRTKGKKEESESENAEFSDPESEEESDAGPSQRRRRHALSSDEEMADEDRSWNPSPKRTKVYSLGTNKRSSSDESKPRKSSSGSASADAEKAEERRTKRRDGRGGTELEAVLDAFLLFCEQYRDTVESEAVKQSIDCFTSNVKQQILEKVNSYMEFKGLKRENAKVGSLIRRKTQRLLDAKYELMRAERQAALLQKEKDELELRLADLRRGQAFLHDIRELNRRYVAFRLKHPRERETYGAASLPALLLETKSLQSAEQQLKEINNRLEKRAKTRS